MNQKLLKVDWNVAKGKIETLKQQAITKVADRATNTKSFISDKFESTKSASLGKIADRGINLTRKQLDALERFKSRVSR